MYKHLDLFSGIGGFSLGLEATGEFETVAFCDYEPFCQKVLRKHWEEVPIYGDIKELTYEKLRADGIDQIDIITGGYPCQPFSVAGNKKGEQDPRHLWPEYFRLVKECRPTWVIGENVGGHIKLGLDTVLKDLESEGYSTRTFSISAASIGANHKRERVWIVAYSECNANLREKSRVNGEEKKMESKHRENDSASGEFIRTSTVRKSDNGYDETLANSNDRLSNGKNEEVRTGRNTFNNGSSDLANSGSERLEGHRREYELREDSEEGKVSRSSENVANSDNTGNRTSEYAVNKNRQKIDKRRQEQSQFKSSRQSEDVANSERIRQQGPGKPIGSSNTETNSNGKTSGFNHGSEGEEGWWDVEPNVGRVAHGISKRVDRLKSLGNSLIPQIPYYIGQSIIQSEKGEIK